MDFFAGMFFAVFVLLLGGWAGWSTTFSSLGRKTNE